MTDTDNVTIKKLNILLVEDSKTDAYSAQRILSKNMTHPCCVIHVECMAEAERTLKDDKNIDLILLDMGLPDTKGGEDTFKRVKSVKKDIPVIILTSVHDHELALEIVGEGAEDYIRKSSLSSDPEILCDAIDFAVCRHKHIEEIKEEVDKEIKEKDQVIGWMSGGYSVDSTK